MPSGSKKRKAAKKRKEKEADINLPSNNPQGSDGFKSQDEKGSDGGEGNSPAYHDHDDNHHHPFNEGSEEVEEGDRSIADPSISGVKPMEEVPGDITNAEVGGGPEFNVVKIEGNLKPEERSNRVNETVENVRSFKESLDGHGNSRGIASDEFIDSGLKSEISSVRTNDSVADVNYTSELVGEQEVSVVKIVSDLEYEKSSDRTNERVDHVESAKESRYGDGNSGGTSNVKSFNENEVKSSDNGSASLEESTISQVAAVDLAMKKHEDKVFPLPEQHVTIPDLVESLRTDYGSKVSASVSENPTPVLESTKDAGHTKGSETPECSENKPQIVLAPRMVQKTSWLNCCGLFDVLSSSNR